MKKIFLLAGLALSLGFATKSDAQVRISVNIGAPVPVMQQSWYGSDCDYYYMPDQGVYYNVNRRMYVWPNGGSWVCGPNLPSSYGNCTWGNSRYYSFRGRSPFMRHDYYRNYYSGRGGYAYGRGGYGGYGGRGDGRYDNRGGGRGWNGDRGGRGGDRGWDGDRGGRGGGRNYGQNNGGGYNGNGGNSGGYNGNGGNGGGYNGNNNGGGGYNGNNGGGGRGGWDRR